MTTETRKPRAPRSDKGRARKPYKAERMKGREITLPDIAWHYAQSQAGGASAYIRRLIEADMQQVVLAPEELIV